ncbi:energy transducer TonB [Hyphococcus flavus]|uniref:Energy transducer TonB n=1 Tax=Hyphococcus flavus TaxID=1866326 RepID=A0AAE9Z9Z2_9PROT|nr:energy transducer TonB [Hyphococcus flavus]WDI30204.1 energy transducer TonB [Hyphococcus flavus]
MNFKSIAKIVSGASITILLFFSAPASAQTYLDEYKLYQQAIEDGDPEAALRHGRAAWQAAEEELGDHNLTGILAFNYGQQALYTDAEAALEALRRADELAKAGIAELPKDDLALFLAYADFEIDDSSRRRAANLRNILEDIENSGATTTTDVAKMWLGLALSDVQNGRYNHAKKSAPSAEAAVVSVSPEDYRTRATTLILQGIPLLVPTPRHRREIQNSLELFETAIELFPPQKSIDDFDQILAQALAWEHAGHAAYVSDDHRGEAHPEGSYEYTLFEPRMKSAEECGIEWTNRSPPKYPPKALQRGYIGAIVVGYSLDDNDKVLEPRILAEVPRGVFGEITLESMKDWRLETTVLDDPQCRKNRLTMFSFIIH